MSVTYIGITIGPIYQTMSLTSSPAGLWMASSVFSWIARSLIEALTRPREDSRPLVPREAFAAPFFTLDAAGRVSAADPNDPKDVCSDMERKGVGLFHDRIIYRADQSDVNRSLHAAAIARDEVTDTLAARLSANTGKTHEEVRQWLERYLVIYAAAVAVPEDSSPLTCIGNYMSGLELEPSFPTREKDNLLLRLMENVTAENAPRDHRNAAVKSSFLVTALGNNGADWMLYESGSDSIRDISSIARTGGDGGKFKCQDYYAVLKSDGDSMGEMLKTLKTPPEIMRYSRQCLKFCADAAKVLLHYGALPIYAGGDDLLAIMPVLGFNSETGETCDIFSMVERLRTLFNKSFEEAREAHGGKPTISFGISIQHCKSPIYEALECAGDMLYRAKSGAKNACAISLRKHSGQQALFYETKMDLHKDEARNYENLCEAIGRQSLLGLNPGTAQMLRSAGYQIARFEPLFKEALRLEEDARRQTLINLFDNLFDNVGQASFKSYLEKLRNIVIQVFRETPAPKPSETCKDEEKRLDAHFKIIMDQVQGIVRFLHFMSEEASS